MQKRNQHFVPRSFLRGFAIEGSDSLIWGYDKKYGKCTGKRSVSTICSFDYYYEQIKRDGTKTQILEDGFQKIETPAIEIIYRLFKTRGLSQEDKGCLAFYIGLLLTRGPAFREGIHKYLKHAVEITGQKLYDSGKLPEMPDILKKDMVNNDITSVIKTQILPFASLPYMVQVADEIGTSLCYKKWDIYISDNNDFFATSDTPIIFGAAFSNVDIAVGPASSKSMVLCPLTKRILMVARPYCDSDQHYFEIKPIKGGMVNSINHLVCFNAERFVYASSQSQELLDYVKKSKGYCKKNMAYRFGDAIIQQWDMNFPS